MDGLSTHRSEPYTTANRTLIFRDSTRPEVRGTTVLTMHIILNFRSLLPTLECGLITKMRHWRLLALKRNWLWLPKILSLDKSVTGSPSTA